MTTSSAPSKTRRTFLSQFVERPAMIGAVAPSSRHLAEQVLDGIDLYNAEAVMEFGPGTGAVTEHILPRLGPRTRFIAVELNSALAESFRRRFPKVRLYEDSVENARRICDQEGIEQVDAIVCGLPWASFSDELQDRLLDATLSVLKPGGRFVSFAYYLGVWLPAGRRIRRKLAARFSETRKSRCVWRNLPPAFVYRCVK